MIKFDAENNVQEYTLILSRRNHQHLGQLRNVTDLVSKINMNAANEISFTVYKGSEAEDEETEPLWDDITDFKYVFVKELNEYYEITVDLNDGEDMFKTVTGTSACECELSQTIIYGLEINTESDITREDYVNPTIFYKPDNPDESLLHRALYKVPQYSIKHVDSSLANIQRTFSADGQDVYSFLTSTIAEEIGCLFTFDTVDRSISVYDLNTVCLDCGYRGEYSDECPECGSKNIKYYGEDTTVYIDTENLAEEITFTTDTESVKNCFKLEAGDDNMTAAVINLNPNGSSYIYYFSEDQKKDMSAALVEKMADYDALNESYRVEYETVMSNMYEAIDKIVYYTSEMMPTRENEPTDAAKEAAKLTEANLSPTGLTTVSPSTSTTTVNTALKNYAKVYINSGKFKIEVNEGEFTYAGTDEEEYNYGYWYGNFRVTNYSDEEDTALSEYVRIKIYDSYRDFLEQKIVKKLAESKEEDGSIFDVLSIKELEPFKEALTYYGLNRLTSFSDAIQGVIDIMIEQDQAKEGSSFYEEFYVPYRDKLDACQAEIDKRSATIAEWETVLETAQKRQREIQEILDFEKYLGEELYHEFCCYRREDIYTNENYISDGLTNDEIFERAKEFYEEAQKAIIKSGEHQHSITSTLTNLLAMEEFQPLKDKFAISNFIRIGIDGKVYRLRLISYQITFGDTSNIDVEFSDVTKIRDGASDMEDILNQAASMASSYDGVMHQVDKSKESDDLIRNWVENGLDLTNMKIMSTADNQNFVQDKHGLLIRTYDDIEEAFSPEQMKLVNSTLAITDDNWRTIKTAVGRYYYQDPTTGEYRKAYGVLGETIVGKLFLGESLGIYSNDAYASMTFDNRGLILNAKRGADQQYRNIIDIQIDGKSVFYISRDGDLVIDNGQLETIEGDLSSKVDKSGVVLAINQSTETIKIQASKIQLEGLVTANNYFKILTDGSMEAVNGKFSGNITSTSGKIGRYEITSTSLKTGSGSTCAGIGGDQAFWAGSSTSNSAPFRVSYNGVLYASGANISGSITGSTITGGTINGTTINGSTITATAQKTYVIKAGDPEKIRQTIMGNYTPTDEEFRNWDIDNNGYISSRDYLFANNILNGEMSGTFTMSLTIGVIDGLLSIKSSSTNGSRTFESILNPGSLNISNIYTNGMNSSSTHTQFLYIESENINAGGTISTGIRNNVPIFSISSDYVTDAGMYFVPIEISASDQPIYYHGSYHDFYCNTGLGFEIWGSPCFIDFRNNYSSSDYTHRLLCNTGGGITAYPSISSASDSRLKKDIQSLDDKYLNVLNELETKTYRYKKNDKNLNIGLVAQDVLEVMKKYNIEDTPIVDQDELEGMYSIDYSQVTSLLVYGWQQHQKEITELKDKINQLQITIDTLTSEKV